MLGLPNESIRPFTKIKACELHRKDQSLFCKAEKVFASIKSEAVQMGLAVNLEAFRNMTVAEWDSIFARSFMSIVAKIGNAQEKVWSNKKIEKVGELNYSTFYKYLKEAGM